MRNGCIQFLSKKHNGGYGDRLIGMASVVTIARILEFDCTYRFEEDFMKHCISSEYSTHSITPTSTLDLINQRSSSVLETENLPVLWAGKCIAIQSNIPLHGLLWKNPFLQDLLKGRSYDTETLQSFQELFSKYIQFAFVLPTIQYTCGIQIRVGDTYCMPHSLAEQYIPTRQFPAVASSMKTYLKKRGIQGVIYVTCDTFHMYQHFTALNDSEYTFVFRNRTDDIHFDFYNSNNRYKEILEDHRTLMQCKTIVTGLRSNFGTSAAYCSPVCSELVLYTSDWKNDVTYTSYTPNSVLILKEYKDHLTDGTPSTMTRLSLDPLVHE